MADNFRYRKGETDPVVVDFLAATALEISDCCWLDTTNGAKPAATSVIGGSAAATRVTFHNFFLGVVMQRHPANVTVPGSPALKCRICTRGTFEFDITAIVGANVEVGALLGMDNGGGNTALQNQKVVVVTVENESIGRVPMRTLIGATKIQCVIVSTMVLGGPQAKA